ncbi:MAG: DUF4276 family protein [Magnetococcus sp. THC-1_WYH]
MQFEILVEGVSDKTTLWHVLPKILGPRGQPHLWNIRKHQGIGRLPDDPDVRTKITDNTLLGQLPIKLRAYEETLDRDAIVVVLVDLDGKDETVFRTQLENLVARMTHRLNVLVCFAIEETEAWYLGDQMALFKAFPEAQHRKSLVDGYVLDDPACGTWELLVRITLGQDPAILRKRGRYESGEIKVQLANKISPHMDVETNRSPSFQAFRNRLRKTVGLPTPLSKPA